MKLTIATIYDSKAEVYTNPMFFQSSAHAMRSFQDEVNRDGSEFAKHPEDYVLFRLGEFDQRSGAIELDLAPVSLSVGISLVDWAKEEAS